MGDKTNEEGVVEGVKKDRNGVEVVEREAAVGWNCVRVKCARRDRKTNIFKGFSGDRSKLS